MEIDDYKNLNLHVGLPRNAKINGRSNYELVQALAVPEDRQYHPCAEAYPLPGGVEGRLINLSDWSDSRIFPDTYRDITFYLPAGDVHAELPVMIFNDGLMYADPDGPVRATRVLDTLIHSGKLPMMVAVFVMPGRLQAGTGGLPPDQVDPADMQQRSYEYDSLTPEYGRFLLEEILPLAASNLSVSLTTQATDRAVCGISSGGICAFNTAWHFPEYFTKVISHCGSFVNIRGGHHYPYLVRTSERKPLRVFLTSGRKDGDILYGNWPLANQQMASALEYAGYNFRFEFGEGGHSLRHGGALFADTLKWLWQNSDHRESA